MKTKKRIPVTIEFAGKDAAWFHTLSRAIGVTPEEIVTTIVAFHLLELRIEDAHRAGVL